MVKKKSHIPPNETPEARFVRVATTKVNAILRNLKTLSRLKGSTPTQRKAIDDALMAGLRDTVASLAGNKVETGGFKL